MLAPPCAWSCDHLVCWLLDQISPPRFQSTPFFLLVGIPCSSFFFCHMPKMIGLLITFSVNMLKHVQMISHMVNVCPVQHVLRLLHHCSELLIVDLQFPIYPVHSQVRVTQDLNPHLVTPSKIPHPQLLPFLHLVLLSFHLSFALSIFCASERRFTPLFVLIFSERPFSQLLSRPYQASPIIGHSPPCLTTTPFHPQTAPIRVHYSSSSPFSFCLDSQDRELLHKWIFALSTEGAHASEYSSSSCPSPCFSSCGKSSLCNSTSSAESDIQSIRRPLHFIHKLPQFVCTTPALLLFILSWFSSTSGSSLSPPRVRMRQNIPHHPVRLLVSLLVENLLFLIPNTLQNQIFNVFSSSFNKSLFCFPNRVCSEPLQTPTLLSTCSWAHEIQIPAFPPM